jgi:hypothetical protein
MNDAVGRVAGIVAALGAGNVAGATGELVGLSQPTARIKQNMRRKQRIVPDQFRVELKKSGHTQVYHNSSDQRRHQRP